MANTSFYSNYLPRIYALPFNHFFTERVRQYRAQLNLPPNGIADSAKANRWLLRYFRSYPRARFPYLGWLPKPDDLKAVVLADKPWYAVTLLTKGQVADDLKVVEPADEPLKQTANPLKNAAWRLLVEFGLPEGMEMLIVYYVISNNALFLMRYPPPAVIEVQAGIDETYLASSYPMLKVEINVKGITFLTTREEWMRLWDSISSAFADFDLAAAEMSAGTFPTLKVKGRRPGRGEVLEERVRRYAEWYDLSERQGLGPSKALEAWETSHPEHGKSYDVSAVTKAISRFRALIEPAQSLVEI